MCQNFGSIMISMISRFFFFSKLTLSLWRSMTSAWWSSGEATVFCVWGVDKVLCPIFILTISISWPYWLSHCIVSINRLQCTLDNFLYKINRSNLLQILLINLTSLIFICSLMNICLFSHIKTICHCICWHSLVISYLGFISICIEFSCLQYGTVLSLPNHNHLQNIQ